MFNVLRLRKSGADLIEAIDRTIKALDRYIAEYDRERALPHDLRVKLPGLQLGNYPDYMLDVEKAKRYRVELCALKPHVTSREVYELSPNDLTHFYWFDEIETPEPPAVTPS